MSSNAKFGLRVEFLTRLKNQSSEQRQAKSDVIKRLLFDWETFKHAHTVLFYASLTGEVETFAMMRAAQQLKKRIALPVIGQDTKTMVPTLIDSVDTLTQGPYGISQPKADTLKVLPCQDLDVVIVPGLAFDRDNNRLGRGAGYYDRFLSALSPQTVTVGLAFDFQVVDHLPVEPHDKALSRVIAA